MRLVIPIKLKSIVFCELKKRFRKLGKFGNNWMYKIVEYHQE